MKYEPLKTDFILRTFKQKSPFKEAGTQWSLPLELRRLRSRSVNVLSPFNRKTTIPK